jgi:hypothetical protein
VALQAPAKIIGLDETGGVLQMKFPVARGSKVELMHLLLGQLKTFQIASMNFSINSAQN